MALISCPDCNAQISDAAPTCPHCGRPMAAAPVLVEQTGKRYKGMLAFGFIGCVVGLVLAAISSVVGFTMWPAFLFAMFCLALYLYAVAAAWWNHG